ncbi:MAG: beta-Ala-His dipeptidase [Lachnospiraceae bacterium]|nr:beta-Ala-His dipeptidase [Lachnospiraceae bacterium]
MREYDTGKKIIAALTAALLLGTTALTGCSVVLKTDDGQDITVYSDDMFMEGAVSDEAAPNETVAEEAVADSKEDTKSEEEKEPEKNVTEEASDEEVIEEVTENFLMLAETPRQSKHEKAISDKLKAWAEDLGYEVRQNKANDLIFDVGATEGLEDLPLVALQAHIDMVCVADDGVDFDPQKDAIKVLIDKDEGTMTAAGTTLGADDGSGVAMIMSIVEGRMEHGPLRVIFTTDEEVEMTGALAITSEDLKGVKYLINIDSEESDVVTVSSAASSAIRVEEEPELKDAEKDTALMISISNLLGGHSGIMINEGRCNGIIAVAGVLLKLSDKVPFELASFNGGIAHNAIPAKAEAVILVDKKDKAEVEKFVEEAQKELRKEYDGIEEDLTLSVDECEKPGKVYDEKQAKSVLDYITGSINGVYTMSEDVEGLVESSANLGQITMDEKGIVIVQMPRSSSEEKLEEINEFQKELAKKNGLDIDVKNDTKPWPVKADSKLVPRIQEIYKEQNGEEISVEGIHAGLECGAFSELVDGLDMVSIGPDIYGAHSPDETLYLKSIPKVWHLLEDLLGSGI